MGRKQGQDQQSGKKPEKGGKSGKNGKGDKNKKPQKVKEEKKRAAPKSAIQLAAEKLLHVAQCLARSKAVEAEIKTRKAELVAGGMEPEVAGKQARAEAVERCKAPAAEMITRDQRGKQYKFKKVDADRASTSAETADSHFIQQNGSKVAAEGGEEQTMSNANVTPKKIIDAAAGTTENAGAEIGAEQQVGEQCEERRLAVSNLKDLLQHVNFETGVEIPGYIDLVSALDGTLLTRDTTFVVPILGRECGELVVKTRAFYSEDEARICVEAENEHYGLRKDDVVRYRSLSAVLQREKQAFDAWMVIKSISWRDKSTWRSRTEMLGHMADPFGLPLVAGELPAIDDKAKNAVLSTWDDYREDLSHFIQECGSRLPEEPEQWTEFLRRFDEDRRRRSKRNPRFPISLLSTNLFKSEMPDGAVIAVPEAMLDMVLDALADANVKVHYSWAYRWLTQTREMLPWFAARAKEQLEELEEQKRQEEERKREAERQAAKKAAQDVVRSRFHEQLAKLGGRGVSNPSRERDDDDRDQRGGGRRWNGNRASDAGR